MTRCSICGQKFYKNLIKLHEQSDVFIHTKCLKKMWNKAKLQKQKEETK